MADTASFTELSAYFNEYLVGDFVMILAMFLETTP